jgi:cellobiose-specific phosphotransferase system component IIC
MSRSSVASRLSSAAYSLRRFAELPFVAATRDALPWSFGGLVAAFVCILPFVPAAGPWWGPSLGLRIAGALLPAFGFMGAVLAPALVWRFAVRSELQPVAPALGALLAYLAAMPPPHAPVLAYLREVGTSGLFLALLIGGLTAFFILLLRGNGWLAGLAAFATALALRASHVDLPAIVNLALAPLGHLGDTFAALLIIVFVQSALWTFGMHGPALVAAVVTPVYLTLQMQNTQAFNEHAALPHIVVVSLFLFIFPGGSGSTLPLAALLAISRVPKLRSIGRVSLVPSVFNTNEPLIFGAPIVLNPYLIPPFLLVPLVLASTTYAAVAFGWVSRAAFYVPSSVPTLVSTYLATVDLRAVALAAVNIALATAIYFPFVRAYERHLEAAV